MAIDDQALKDALRAIEAGEIPEDLDLPDPEDYDDMGGIKSLDRDAPSIKMASEPGDDEAVIEIGQMLEAYEDAVKNGYEGDIKEFSEYYFGQMKMDQDRKMASEPSEDELQLELGTVYEEFLDAVKEGFQGSFDDYAKQYFTRKKAMQDRQMAMNGGRMKYNDGTGKDEIPKALSRMEKDYPDAMKKKYNFMDLIDTKAEDEYYKTKEELLDRKYNAKNYPPSQRNMSMEELKKMLKKAEEDKVKRAKGGIAGVL